MLDYIPQAEYKKHIEPMIPLFRDAVKDLKENTIGSKNANQFIDYLMKFANELAGKTNAIDRSMQNIFGEERGRQMLNGVSGFSNRIRSGLVVGNINTMLAQFYNLPNVVALAKNPIDILAGMGEAISAPFGNKASQETLAKSHFLRERYLDRSFRRFDTDKTRFAKEVIVRSLELGDKAIADSAFLTFYRQALKDGLDDAAAVLRADDLTRRAVGGRGIGEMPIAQKSKLVKILAPFQVEVQNSWNLVKELADVRGKSPAKAAQDIGSLLAMIGTYHLMNEGLYAITGRRIGFDPIHYIREYIDADEEDRSLGRTAANIFGNVVSNMPYGSYLATGLQGLGGMTDYDTEKIFGTEDPSRYGVGGAALETIAEPVGQYIAGQNVNFLKPAAVIGLPYGGRQIEKAVRGLQDMDVLPRLNFQRQDGGPWPGMPNVKNQPFPASYSARGALRFPIERTAGNMAKAAMFGPFATPEGKSYLESGYKPLSAEQTTKIEEAYGREAVRDKIPPAAVFGVVRNRELADINKSNGISDKELKAYAVKVAAEYGLPSSYGDVIFRIIKGEPDKKKEWTP
jgi:hypothetical protein